MPVPEDEEESRVADGNCDDEAETGEAVGEFWATNLDGKAGNRLITSEDGEEEDEDEDDAEDEDSGRRGGDRPEDGQRPPYFKDGAKSLDGSRLNVTCPSCDTTNRVRLPKGLSLAEGEDEGRIMRTRCGKCGETVRFRAPEGFNFAKPTLAEGSALRHFMRRYFSESSPTFGGSLSPDRRVRNARTALETFRQSLRDSKRGR
jgi:hypothetical protein